MAKPTTFAMARGGEFTTEEFAYWKDLSKPMPEKRTIIELNHQFSEDQMKAIRKGFAPREMEEKWFVYYEEEERKLYLHRSWTGFCVYIVEFEERGDGYAAVSMVVNRDPEQYKCSDDEEDKKLVISIIGSVLLGQYGFVPGLNPLESWSLLGRQSLGPGNQ